MRQQEIPEGRAQDEAADATVLSRMQTQYHPRCIVCSGTNPRSLDLGLQLDPDDVLRGTFVLGEDAEGYPGWAHGGGVATILDGAMGNWLFGHGVIAVTVTLDIQYRRPLCLREPAWVEARLLERRRSLHVLKAWVGQGNHHVARALGRFVDQPDRVPVAPVVT